MQSTSFPSTHRFTASAALCIAALLSGCGDSTSSSIDWDAGNDGDDQGKGGAGQGGDPQGGGGGSANGNTENGGGSENGGSPNGGSGGSGGNPSTCEPSEIACGDGCCDGGSQQCVANECVCKTNTVCGEGQVCNDSHSCVEGCLINGTAYAHGKRNPSNDCQVCNSSTMTAWVPAYPGSSCAQDGGDTCNAGGVCLRRDRLSAGQSRSCAITPTGAAVCWGSGTGTVGNGQTASQVVDQASNMMSISSDERHTCSLSMEGIVTCWGWNTDGQLGDGTTKTASTPVAVTDLDSGVKAVSAGFRNTCAITAAGGAVCWGNNDSGQVGDGSKTQSLTPKKVVGLDSGIVAISVGGWHACALNTEGGVKCWGGASYGTIGNGFNDFGIPFPTQVFGLELGVAAIAAGYEHTCALTKAGAVLCWGRNAEGQLGDKTTVNKNVPTPVVGLESGIVAITAGYDHSCAVTTSGAVRCWGYNAYGQLGGNGKYNSTESVQVANLYSGVIAVSAAHYHTCAYTSADKIMCWGRNDSWQIGDGSSTERYTPVEVVGFP